MPVSNTLNMSDFFCSVIVVQFSSYISANHKSDQSTVVYGIVYAFLKYLYT
jgi:hypothetical protein